MGKATAHRLVASIDEQLDRFWQVEELHGLNYFSIDEEMCEDCYRVTVSCDSTGQLPKQNTYCILLGHMIQVSLIKEDDPKACYLAHFHIILP